MKIAVLMGGLSKEREISLKSGSAIAEALLKKGHQVEKIDMTNWSSIQKLSEVKPEAVFIALHGKFGEDGRIQGLMEWMKIPYTGPGVLGSAICFDKALTKKIVSQEKIPTPEYVLFQKGQDLEKFISAKTWKLPLIVKPNTEGSTIGITRVFEKNELKPAIESALNFDSVVLVEQFIKGRELTVGVVHSKALPIIEIVPKSGFYDFESKYTKGKTEYLVPAPLEESLNLQILEYSSRISKILNLRGAVRIDWMLSEKNEPYMLEVNTIPGMTETSLLPKAAKVLGISFEDLCESIVIKAGFDA